MVRVYSLWRVNISRVEREREREREAAKRWEGEEEGNPRQGPPGVGVK